MTGFYNVATDHRQTIWDWDIFLLTNFLCQNYKIMLVLRSPLQLPLHLARILKPWVTRLYLINSTCLSSALCSMKLENGAAGARASILEGLTLLVLGFRITLILDSCWNGWGNERKNRLRFNQKQDVGKSSNLWYGNSLEKTSTGLSSGG